MQLTKKPRTLRIPVVRVQNTDGSWMVGLWTFFRVMQLVRQSCCSLSEEIILHLHI